MEQTRSRLCIICNNSFQSQSEEEHVCEACNVIVVAAMKNSADEDNINVLLDNCASYPQHATESQGLLNVGTNKPRQTTDSQGLSDAGTGTNNPQHRTEDSLSANSK
jgi:hypothetical protein